MPQFEKTWLHPLIILTSISPLLPDNKADAPCSNSTCGLRAQCHNFSSGSFICKCDRNGDYPFGTIVVVYNQVIYLIIINVSHYHFCIKQETPTSSAMNVTPTLSARLLRSVTKALVRSCRPSPVAGVS